MITVLGSSAGEDECLNPAGFSHVPVSTPPVHLYQADETAKDFRCMSAGRLPPLPQVQ